MGVGRVIRKKDRISFELDIENNICKGDINDQACRRWFYKGKCPDICCIAVLNFTGVGEFQLGARSLLNDNALHVQTQMSPGSLSSFNFKD